MRGDGHPRRGSRSGGRVVAEGAAPRSGRKCFGTNGPLTILRASAPRLRCRDRPRHAQGPRTKSAAGHDPSGTRPEHGTTGPSGPAIVPGPHIGLGGRDPRGPGVPEQGTDLSDPRVAPRRFDCPAYLPRRTGPCSHHRLGRPGSASSEATRPALERHPGGTANGPAGNDSDLHPRRKRPTGTKGLVPRGRKARPARVRRSSDRPGRTSSDGR